MLSFFTGQDLLDPWALAAHLCDPHHIHEYHIELETRGPLPIHPEGAWDPKKHLPDGIVVPDSDKHRYMIHFASRALRFDVAHKVLGAEHGSPQMDAFRQQLGEYLHRTGRFTQQNARHMWNLAQYDALGVRGRVPRAETLGTMWRDPDIGAPELQVVMESLAEIYSSQSGVERKNGLIKRVTGSSVQNNLTMQARRNMCLIADSCNAGLEAASSRSRTRAIRSLGEAQSSQDSDPPTDAEEAESSLEPR